MRLLSFSMATLILALPLISKELYANPNTQGEGNLSPEQRLGRDLFFDARLSSPVGMSCASCHDPRRAFSDPRSGQPVSEGVRPGRFTPRNAPSLMYLAEVPALRYEKDEDVYVGGLFLDGRVNSLEQQVEGPLLHPAEMANLDKAAVIQSLRAAGYASRFDAVYGANALTDTTQAFGFLARALSSFERSKVLNPFSSKYDYYLQGKARLTAQELRGARLFEDEKKGNCAACHPMELRNDFDPPLFTDFTYDNLGVPANPESPFYKQARSINPAGEKFVDRGLGKTLNDPAQNGKFRVPTLRNVELTGPYMHNGVFATLKEVVEFYSSRDVDKRWGKPEVSENVNTDELGDLKLTEQEIEDIVVFMQTLTDGYPVQ